MKDDVYESMRRWNNGISAERDGLKLKCEKLQAQVQALEQQLVYIDSVMEAGQLKWLKYALGGRHQFGFQFCYLLLGDALVKIRVNSMDVTSNTMGRFSDYDFRFRAAPTDVKVTGTIVERVPGDK